MTRRSSRDRTLNDVAHVNMVEAFASLPPHQDEGLVSRLDDVVIAVTGSPISIFNVVFPVGRRVAPDAMAEAVRIVRARGLGLVVYLRAGVDDHVVTVMRDLGLEEHPYVSLPAMVLPVLPTALEAPNGLVIRPVVDSAGLDDLLTATGGGEDASGLSRNWMVADPRWDLFVGYADGVPVAKSMGFRHGDLVGVYNVGTAEKARRRGYGWAMTMAVLVAGAAAGCSGATLQSSVMGLPMYEKHGFRTVFRYRGFQGAPAH